MAGQGHWSGPQVLWDISAGQHSCNSQDLSFSLGLSLTSPFSPLHRKVIRINLGEMGFLEMTDMERG